MNLKFNMVLEVVEVRVHAKFHKAECSGSWVIVVTEEKKLQLAVMLKTILPPSLGSKYVQKCFFCFSAFLTGVSSISAKQQEMHLT